MARNFDAFVILADMRTGSNALEERLNDYAGLQCYGEAFNPVFVGRPKTDALFGVGLEQRDKDPLALIETLRKNTDGLAGFRLFSDHDPRVIDHVLSNRAIAKIILTRSALDSFVSLGIARATGQWWLADMKARREGKIVFDPAAFEEFATRRAAHLRHVRNALKTSGQVGFEISYEDLGDAQVIDGCARFLGARDKKEAEGRKGRVQNPVPLSEKVENFDQMRAALAARDPFDTDHHPDFEPARGPNVPSFMAAGDVPLLYLPVKSASDIALRGWIETVAGGPANVATGFTQKSLRAWKRRSGPHRAFTVVAHPLWRAHEAFCRFILPSEPPAFVRIRQVLRRTYKVPLPDAPDESGYDAEAHARAFLAFLKVLKGNLSGQTAIRVDAAWASQVEIVKGLSAFCPPDAILRAETLHRDLPALGAQLGIEFPDAPRLPDGHPFALSEIYSDRIERAARQAYQKDYMMFGYGAWCDDTTLPPRA